MPGPRASGCSPRGRLSPSVAQWRAVSVFQSLRDALRPADSRAIRMPGALRSPSSATPVLLRPLTIDDADEWNDLRWDNDDWLRPWESGDPTHGPLLTFNAWLQRQRRSQAEGTGALFVIEHQSRIVGQVSLGAIDYGSMRTGVVGYWVDHAHAGRGFAPMAVALLADWAFADPTGPNLHRLEIALLPDNERSRRVAEKVGAHHEGLRPRYMYVNGQWRDHDTYCLLAEDIGEGFAARLAQGR